MANTLYIICIINFIYIQYTICCKMWLGARRLTFFSKPITGTALHHQTGSNYQPLSTNYGSLLANYKHYYFITSHTYMALTIKMFSITSDLPTRLAHLPQITAGNEKLPTCQLCGNEIVHLYSVCGGGFRPPPIFPSYLKNYAT